MTQYSNANAMDHVILVLFENRSLDNMLGHLYGPASVKTFEGVIGKDLSNPVPAGVHSLGQAALPNAEILDGVVAAGVTLHEFVGA